MPLTSAPVRTLRRRRLLELLQAGFEGTQEQIVDRLGKEGFRVTQATVSRDLEELGAVRRRTGDRTLYSLSPTNGPPAGLGRRVLGELVASTAVSGNLVVVRTFPGLAPTVAAVLDSLELPGALGTVAGDDTVLVVAAERVGGKALGREISRSLRAPRENQLRPRIRGSARSVRRRARS